jgi:hypothetical protein
VAASLVDRDARLLLLALSIRNLAHALRTGIVKPWVAASFLEDYARDLEDLKSEDNRRQ